MIRLLVRLVVGLLIGASAMPAAWAQ
ncbi:MAG: hypothetical protein RL458_3068, partial [Pseudomonadota bacterium]